MGLIGSGAARVLTAVLAALLVASPVCASTESARVFELVGQRLGYMKEVARYKASTGTAVEDRYREAIVIDKAKKRAEKLGLAPASIEGFFRAQMAAAKVIQYRYLADWTLSQRMPGGKPADLEVELRPILNQLGDEIVLAIKVYLDTGKRFGDEQLGEFLRIVEVEKLDESDEIALYESMRAITLAK